MDDQRKDHIYPKISPQMNRPKQLQTNNVPTYNVKNTNSTNKGRDLQLIKSLIVPQGTYRMLQSIQRHRKVTLHWSVHPQREQDETEKSSWQQKVHDMIPQSWMICSWKKYKISDGVINFIEKTMKIWSVELTAGGKTLAETKTQRGIFQGDSLSPLLFVIAMMPLNQILRKCTARYKLNESREKINHLIYVYDIKLLANKEKRIGNSNLVQI